MAPLLLVVGSVNYDLIWSHPRLPGAGESVVGAQLHESPGGKGANQAVAARRSSRGRSELRVVFGGAIGDDHYGRLQRETLEGDGVDTSGLVVVPGAHTGTSSVWVDSSSGENRILSAPGANALFGPDCIESLPVEESTLVLVPNEIPAATIVALLDRASGADVPVVWNPAPFDPGASRPVPAGAARWVTPNEIEAAHLTSAEGSHGDPGNAAFGDSAGDPELTRAWLMAEALVRQGERGVVVTLGARGAIALDGERRYAVAAPAVEAVDTTGAGDAFNGALAAALACGSPFAAALELAVAYASDSVRRRGTQTSYASGVSLP